MKAYIALGANLGNCRRTITQVIRLLGCSQEISIEDVSRFYRTQAVGGPKQKDYLNGVAHLQTRLKPMELMDRLLQIERQLGRVRRKKWGPRIIDLDLLAYGSACVRRPGLEIPHPRYHLRRFVLVPFCDVAPRYVHPRLKLQNRSLLRKLTPHGQRVTIAAQWNGTRFTPSKSKKQKKSRS